MFRYVATFVLLILISCNRNTNEIKVQKNKLASFSSVFKLIDSTRIEANKANPIYSIFRLTTIDSSYFLIDRKNYQILHYDINGGFINKWGKKGRGPGEFLNPVWIGSTPNKNLFVIDSGGNFSVQIFSQSGEIIDTFPLRSNGPFLQSNIFNNKNDTLFITTTIKDCNDQVGNECIMQVQDLNGTVIRQFATSEEIAPNSVGLPFHSALMEKDKSIYITHVYGKKMTVYSINGEKKFDFSLDISPSVKPLEMSSLPQDVYAQVRKMRNRSFTYVGDVYASNNKIFIQYYRNGKDYKENKTKSFIDIYGAKGKLMYHGINTKYRLMEVQNDFFHFMKEQRKNSNLGEYIIYKYEFKG